MRYLGPRIVAQALLWAIKWLRSRPRTQSRRSAKPHASTPPNPTDSPRRRKQPPKLVNKIIKKNNQSPKVIPPNRRSPLRRSEQVMRAPPLSSSPRRTQYARITCEPARKLPRRHYRANTPSAALQNNPRPAPNLTPRCALHRIRTPPGEVVARRVRTRGTQAAETPLSSQLPQRVRGGALVKGAGVRRPAVRSEHVLRVRASKIEPAVCVLSTQLSR